MFTLYRSAALTLTVKTWNWALDYCDEEGLLSWQVGPLVIEYSY